MAPELSGITPDWVKHTPGDIIIPRKTSHPFFLRTDSSHLDIQNAVNVPVNREFKSIVLPFTQQHRTLTKKPSSFDQFSRT